MTAQLAKQETLPAWHVTLRSNGCLWRHLCFARTEAQATLSALDHADNMDPDGSHWIIAVQAVTPRALA